jgi:uncharacterized protein YjbJ (UPF0337 family)
MNRKRITGSANQVKGSLKAAVGRMLGDARLTREGNKDKARGKIQSASAAERSQ